MEFMQLSAKKRKKLVDDITRTMSEKYNISDNSIDKFWNTVILGIQYQETLIKVS